MSNTSLQLKIRPAHLGLSALIGGQVSPIATSHEANVCFYLVCRDAVYQYGKGKFGIPQLVIDNFSLTCLAREVVITSRDPRGVETIIYAQVHKTSHLSGTSAECTDKLTHAQKGSLLSSIQNLADERDPKTGSGFAKSGLNCGSITLV
ncbi:hypothetical protein [Acaryochloris marina]|uniref:Uncharacterized protein n=1 Tax=Acaryochloris marina (strain MBIC 11017) TaxID=329726 RepID=B0C7L5_ACAM1|nr:hypothetical protein [Acaryochloris marina]ABW25275.1 hypothetical protein AM1_0189 [Acaryochloris marina MBIC11017]